MSQTTWAGEPLDLQAARPCRVYLIYGTDPRDQSPEPVLLYVGETARKPAQRIEEHRLRQPWGHLITGYALVDEVYPTKADALLAEEREIKARLPIFNWEHNQRNPARLWWGPAAPAGRTPADLAEPRRELRTVPWASWVRRNRRVLAWSALWLAAFAGGLVATMDRAEMSGQDRVIGSAVTASVLWWMVYSGLRRRKRRKRRR